MTREHKLALVVGFALVLVVGILVSDHFSSARKSNPKGEVALMSANSAGADVTLPPPTYNGAMHAAPVTGDMYSMGGNSTPAAGLSTPVFVPQPATNPDMQAADAGLAQTYEIPPVTPVTTQPTQQYASMQSAGAPQSYAGQPAITDPALIHDHFEPVTGAYNPGTHSGLQRAPAANPLGSTVTLAQTETLQVQPVPAQTQPPSIADAAPQPRTQPAPATGGLPASRGRVITRSIKEGETLYAICQDVYGDGNLWNKLIAHNKGKISSNGSVREGVTLTFPPKDVLQGKAAMPGRGGNNASSPSRPAETAIAGAASGTRSTTYTMQRGDVLSVVAQKTMGSARKLPELLAANRDVVSDPDNVPAGTVLRIPAR